MQNYQSSCPGQSNRQNDRVLSNVTNFGCSQPNSSNTNYIQNQVNTMQHRENSFLGTSGTHIQNRDHRNSFQHQGYLTQTPERFYVNSRTPSEMVNYNPVMGQVKDMSPLVNAAPNNGLEVTQSNVGSPVNSFVRPTTNFGTTYRGNSINSFRFSNRFNAYSSPMNGSGMLQNRSVHSTVISSPVQSMRFNRPPNSNNMPPNSNNMPIRTIVMPNDSEIGYNGGDGRQIRSSGNSFVPEMPQIENSQPGGNPPQVNTTSSTPGSAMFARMPMTTAHSGLTSNSTQTRSSENSCAPESQIFQVSNNSPQVKSSSRSSAMLPRMPIAASHSRPTLASYKSTPRSSSVVTNVPRSFHNEKPRVVSLTADEGDYSENSSALVKSINFSANEYRLPSDTSESSSASIGKGYIPAHLIQPARNSSSTVNRPSILASLNQGVGKNNFIQNSFSSDGGCTSGSGNQPIINRKHFRTNSASGLLTASFNVRITDGSTPGRSNEVPNVRNSIAELMSSSQDSYPSLRRRLFPETSNLAVNDSHTLMGGEITPAYLNQVVSDGYLQNKSSPASAVIDLSKGSFANVESSVQALNVREYLPNRNLSECARSTPANLKHATNEQNYLQKGSSSVKGGSILNSNQPISDREDLRINSPSVRRMSTPAHLHQAINEGSTSSLSIATNSLRRIVAYIDLTKDAEDYKQCNSSSVSEERTANTSRSASYFQNISLPMSAVPALNKMPNGGEYLRNISSSVSQPSTSASFNLKLSDISCGRNCATPIHEKSSLEPLNLSMKDLLARQRPVTVNSESYLQNISSPICEESFREPLNPSVSDKNSMQKKFSSIEDESIPAKLNEAVNGREYLQNDFSSVSGGYIPANPTVTNVDCTQKTFSSGVERITPTALNRPVDSSSLSVNDEATSDTLNQTVGLKESSDLSSLSVCNTDSARKKFSSVRSDLVFINGAVVSAETDLQNRSSLVDGESNPVPSNPSAIDTNSLLKKSPSVRKGSTPASMNRAMNATEHLQNNSSAGRYGTPANLTEVNTTQKNFSSVGGQPTPAILNQGVNIRESNPEPSNPSAIDTNSMLNKSVREGSTPASMNRAMNATEYLENNSSAGRYGTPANLTEVNTTQKNFSSVSGQPTPAILNQGVNISSSSVGNGSTSVNLNRATYRESLLRNITISDRDYWRNKSSSMWRKRPREALTLAASENINKSKSLFMDGGHSSKNQVVNVEESVMNGSGLGPIPTKDVVSLNRSLLDENGTIVNIKSSYLFSNKQTQESRGFSSPEAEQKLEKTDTKQIDSPIDETQINIPDPEEESIELLIDKYHTVLVEAGVQILHKSPQRSMHKLNCNDYNDEDFPMNSENEHLRIEEILKTSKKINNTSQMALKRIEQIPETGSQLLNNSLQEEDKKKMDGEETIRPISNDLTSSILLESSSYSDDELPITTTEECTYIRRYSLLEENAQKLGNESQEKILPISNEQIQQIHNEVVRKFNVKIDRISIFQTSEEKVDDTVIAEELKSSTSRSLEDQSSVNEYIEDQINIYKIVTSIPSQDEFRSSIKLWENAMENKNNSPDVEIVPTDNRKNDIYEGCIAFC